MKKTSGTLLAALAISFVSSGAWANSLTFQGVTFSTTDLGGGELQLSITNALNATGDWSGIKYIESFALVNVGSVTGARVTNIGGFSTDPGGLNSGGCDMHGTGQTCFTAGTSPLALSNKMIIDIAFTGATNFSLPDLKVDFLIDPSQGKATGSLLSQSIPVGATPIPDALPLFTTGLGLIGMFVWWRRRKGTAAIAAA